MRPFDWPTAAIRTIGTRCAADVTGVGAGLARLSNINDSKSAFAPFALIVRHRATLFAEMTDAGTQRWTVRARRRARERKGQRAKGPSLAVAVPA